MKQYMEEATKSLNEISNTLNTISEQLNELKIISRQIEGINILLKYSENTTTSSSYDKENASLKDILEQLEDLSKVDRHIYNRLNYPVIITQEKISPSLREIWDAIRKE